MDAEAKKRQQFKAWFLRAWTELDNRLGRRTTQQELADYLGITRSSIAQYSSARKLPEGDNLRKIGQKMGWEVYELLGVALDLPDTVLRALAAADEVERRIRFDRIKIGSPEAERISKEIFASFAPSHMGICGTKNAPYPYIWW